MLVPILRVHGASRWTRIVLGCPFATRPRSIVALPHCVMTRLVVLAPLLVGLLTILVAHAGQCGGWAFLSMLVVH